MKINAFSVSFDGRRVLDFPGLELEPGQICAVVGANGSGKSTLARAAAGLLSPDGGGRVLDSPCAVGYLPQRPFPFRLRVRKNILLAAPPGEGREARAAALMKELGLTPLAHKAAHKLSGGEAARVALARLLLGEYGLLVLDEPTAAMDMGSTLAAEALAARFCRERGCPCLLVTHSLKQALRAAQYALYLEGGKLVEHGPAERVLRDPLRPETRRFIDFYEL